jgi:tetratricopeptide (TPR) repeat protein/class 3 adenylate cyclase
MFVDLNGFTRLANLLVANGSEGVEQLSIILNAIFEPLVGIVYDRGGFIPYFAGDAFTAIFPEKGQGGARALLATAEAVRQALLGGSTHRVGKDTYKLHAKIGLSQGKVEWGIIGKTAPKAFYFKGEAIEQCAHCQMVADKGEIIADMAIVAATASTKVWFQKKSEQFFSLVQLDLPHSERATRILPVPTYEQLSPFLPDSVLNFNQKGELRNVVSIFIAFNNIADKADFDAFITTVVQQCQNFSGYFKEIDFGDKGNVLVCFFGAPIAFEDMNERALEFILALQEAVQSLLQRRVLAYRVGLSAGIAYAGMVGGEQCYQYAVVGDAVNMAARLMSRAEWGEVLVDEKIQKERGFDFLFKGNVHYKGIEGERPTFAFIGKNMDTNTFYEGDMIGRAAEMQALVRFAQPLRSGRFAGIARIYGEAGIGKSRLCFELHRELERQFTLTWLHSLADQILQKPFNAFIYLFKNYFKQSPQKSPQENQRSFDYEYGRLLERCRRHLADSGGPSDLPHIVDELERLRTVVSWLMGLQGKHLLWEQLDALGRYRNTIAAFKNLLLAESSLGPVVLEIEDAHWLDNSSKAFLQEITRDIKTRPIFLLVTFRYLDDGAKPRLFEDSVLDREHMPHIEFDLNNLPLEGIKRFAEARLKGALDEDFLDLLAKATNGNPFYAEQLLEYFTESGLLAMQDGQWHIKDKSVKLSGSINAILMARIDRLSQLVKETVKAAAVIGREFEVNVLSEVMKLQEDFVERNGNAQTLLQEQIKIAEHGHIWKAVNEIRYIFKHSLLREAVYDMQLRTRLRELHRIIAEAIENLYSDNLDDRYADLAYHYEQAELPDKAVFYLEKVADLARRNYQNNRALSYYEKVLAKYREALNTNKVIRVLLKKGNILELIGQWEQSEADYQEALALANGLVDKQLIGRANNSLGNLLTLKGNYEQARIYLEVGTAFFEDVGDQKGLYKIYGNLGNVFFRQGQYEQAIHYYQRSIALADANDLGLSNARTVANLGLTYMNLGRYEDAIACQLPYLKRCERAENKQGIATMSINLGIVLFDKGDYDEAMEHYQRGLKASEQLGDKLLITIAIGSIGSIYERKGQYDRAMEHFMKDLEISERLGDKQGTAIALGLIGDLYVLQGAFDVGIEYINKNLNLCRELGYKKGLAKSLCVLGDAHLFKKQYDLAFAAYEEAIDICGLIGNRRTHAYALLQKGTLLSEQSRYAEAAQLMGDAANTVAQLGHRELEFTIWAFRAKVKYLSDPQPANEQKLLSLVEKAQSRKEKAVVYYAIAKSGLDPTGKYATMALETYKALLKELPKYLIRKRAEELSALLQKTGGGR